MISWEGKNWLKLCQLYKSDILKEDYQKDFKKLTLFSFRTACHLYVMRMSLVCLACFFHFFSVRIFFTDTDDSQDNRGREGIIFYFTLPLPPAHEHWDIYLQLCMWDDYHVFSIATLVFTRLLLDEIYYLIELPFEWLIDDAMFVCLLNELILGFCYSDLTLETGGFELASTIALVLQANLLPKCTSHPECLLVCHPYVILMYSYVIRMHSFVIRMSLICIRLSSVCHSYVLLCHWYVLACHSYVTRMYFYVMRMSLVCTRMSSLLVCHPYVTHIWFYYEPF